MRRAWFCDGCDREHQTKAGAKACEQMHEPFIRAHILGIRDVEQIRNSAVHPDTTEFPIKDEFVLFHPEHGDIVIQIASLIESIDINAAGPVWIARFHDDEVRAEAEKS